MFADFKTRFSPVNDKKNIPIDWIAFSIYLKKPQIFDGLALSNTIQCFLQLSMNRNKLKYENNKEKKSTKKNVNNFFLFEHNSKSVQLQVHECVYELDAIRYFLQTSPQFCLLNRFFSFSTYPIPMHIHCWYFCLESKGKSDILLRKSLFLRHVQIFAQQIQEKWLFSPYLENINNKEMFELYRKNELYMRHTHRNFMFD